MIIDTSAVIEFLRGTGSRTHLALAHALRDEVPVWIPAVAVQEVLQGARGPGHFIRLQAQLDQLPVFEPEDTHELHRQAALIFARCRWQGVTVRSPMDCVVAACALEADMPLLALDRDFSGIARIEPKLRLLS